MSSWPSLAFPWAECTRTGKPSSSLCGKWPYLKIQGGEWCHEGAGGCVGVTHQIQCTEGRERRTQSSHLVRSDCESRPPGSVLMKQAPCRGYDDVPHPSLGSGRKHDKQMFGASTLFSLHVTIITLGKALTFKCTPLVPFSPLLKVQRYSQPSPTGDQTVPYSMAHARTRGAKVHADCCCTHWSSLFQCGLIFCSTAKLHSSRKHLGIQRD